MRNAFRKWFVGPVLLALIGVSMIGAAYTEGDVTGTVTPWRPLADIAGTTHAVVFSGAFPTKAVCDTFIGSTDFKKTYASIIVFLASHTGQKLGKPHCEQVLPEEKPPAGESI